MTNIVAIESSAEPQIHIAVAELPLDILALVGGGDGAVVPF